MSDTASATFSGTTLASPTSTLDTSSPTSSQSSGSSSSSSPLLFFVALGFGVVFANLWIVLGTRYCLRQRARARFGAANGYGPDNLGPGLTAFDRIVLGDLNHRRERKLMSEEDVNIRFPVETYKQWREQRSRASVTAAHAEREAQRAEIRHIQREKKSDSLSQPDESIDPKDSKSTTVHEEVDVTEIPSSSDSTHLQPLDKLTADSLSADPDNENADTVADLPEDLDTYDTCAICLDNFADDSEVRGLTCRHVFHSDCITPWFTTRRACCPLCKTDYFKRQS
ncbi:hypothetical protein CANCADRAFT_32805, partial [Tortispora caseinolytica NRRL Y-17796]